MMKIFNVRMGLATNSSSSHSLVLFNTPPSDNMGSDTDFGWEFFTASSDESKQNYLALTLYYALRGVVSEEIAKVVVSAWCDQATLELDVDGFGCLNGYIDHQSIIALPCSWDGKGVDKEFFDEFKKFLLQDGLAILGGNDNDEDNHPLLPMSKMIKLPLPLDYHGSHVARKDGDYWTLFDRECGTKISFSFNLNAEPPKFSTVPELIDIKVTDYCDRGCFFCYQDSSPSGKHAEENILVRLARGLGKLRVFEVALGGGEPTMYPNFVSVLREFRDNGIVPNFSTRSLHWLRDPKLWIPIMDSVGAVAYSVENTRDVKEFMALVRANDLAERYDWSCKFALQVIDGVSYEEEIAQILREAKREGLRVTILGYKECGRGDGRRRYKNEKLWKKIMVLRDNYECPRLSIDTTFAKEHEQEILESGISPVLFRTEDGDFSWYIDAVQCVMGASSYCPREEMVDLEIKYGFEDEFVGAIAEYRRRKDV